MKCGVYRIKCLVNGYFYVGSSCDMEKRVLQHLKSLQRGKHHNAFLQRVFNKYGRESFTVRFKETDDLESARELEQKYLDLYGDLKRCMNIGRSASGGDNLTNNPNREKIIKRITKSVQARIDLMTPDERAFVFGKPGKLNGMYGKTHTKKVRKKLSEIHTGNSWAKGSVWSEEARQQLRESIKRRQDAGLYVNAFKGKTHTPEVRKRLKKAARARADAGVLPPNTKRIRVGKKIYRSAAEAGKALGCVTATVLNRARSDRFPDYHILD